MPKLLTEFLGTFFLVLVILLAGPHALTLAPVAIGLILMAMVYMGGHVSGAHYNPAVTLAILIRGKITRSEAIAYWVFQLLGAIAAAAIAAFFNGRTAYPFPPRLFATDLPPGSLVQVWTAAALAEVLFTFALALVVLNVATARATAGNSYYGAAIGLTVCAGAFAAGPISGGAFNPAVGTGPALVAAVMGHPQGLVTIPLYILAPIAGGILAAIVFRLQHPDDR